MKFDHPYTDLPESRVWRTAVSNRSVFDLSDLYNRKFEILTNTRIATAGSCFAQHIAQRLRQNGYSYLDTEPAPHRFPEELAIKHGYGVYSARYGNVYTARQFLQLVQRALGVFRPKHQHFVDDDGRVYDLIRPSVERDGFSCIEEFQISLKDHLDSVRALIETCDLLIFTFGLTEAWIDKRDGTVLPVCPGTIAGQFDPDIYEFKNFSCAEVLSDMQDAISLIRKHNKTIKFMFTVSPVPLVATAEDRHVLVSTTHSKSVLRAAAGELAANDPSIDYFPSFEIISGVPSRGMFFDANLRTVHKKGVDYVMEHFFKAHPPLETIQSEEGKIDVGEQRDPICDELALDTVKE